MGLAGLVSGLSEDIPMVVQYMFECPAEKYLARCLGHTLLLR
jgi:hypothetical protein